MVGGHPAQVVRQVALVVVGMTVRTVEVVALASVAAERQVVASVGCR